ncbi:MAG TPA: F0F1 ATP synthase subunit epsilon, partial [Lachnospiraceae bacterium]|nr:F0F1 ATP synthase subunit epsilon [Lachnospiraceae bacterium]
MAEEKTFLIKIITPERVFYEGTAIMAEFNTSEGEIGVYAGHIPLTV